MERSAGAEPSSERSDRCAGISRLVRSPRSRSSEAPRSWHKAVVLGGGGRDGPGRAVTERFDGGADVRSVMEVSWPARPAVEPPHSYEPLRQRIGKI